MKFFKVLYVFSIILISFACDEDKRIPIKIIETNKGYYEWYYYSLITSDGPDYVDYVDKNCKRTLIFSGHDIIDIDFSNNKLSVECNQCDTLEFNPMYKNQIQIAESDNKTYLEKIKASHQRDSLKRNVKIKRCIVW